jgi:hypothetical protein
VKCDIPLMMKGKVCSSIAMLPEKAEAYCSGD